MTLAEIKNAVDSGKTVHWSNDGYRVTTGGVIDRVYSLRCDWNGWSMGLTWTDGVTMNGKEEDFYIAGGENG